MTVIIEGTVVKGFGVANKNIRFQMPHLVWQFPDIKNIYPGSINVLLEKPLRILSYDYTTLPSPWWDVDDRNPGKWVSERFGFLEIKFEYPVGGPPHRAWFFDCHKSKYHNDPIRFEIISEKIDNLSNGQRCKIYIEKSKVQE
jgi:hypothetical protein